MRVALAALRSALITWYHPRLSQYHEFSLFGDAGPSGVWPFGFGLLDLRMRGGWCLTQFAQLAHLPFPVLVWGCILLPRALSFTSVSLYNHGACHLRNL